MLRKMREAGGNQILLAACVLTLANAIKPAHVDDVIWSYFVQQIGTDPFRPFGFEIPWHQKRAAAIDVTCPPVLPYYWAFVGKLFGTSTLALKLSLFPFSLLLAWSVRVLTEKYAGELKNLAFWILLFSPTIVPAQNLMMDVACFTFTLTAIAVLVRFEANPSPWVAPVAATLFGMSLLTKWTALANVPTFYLALLLFGPRKFRVVFSLLIPAILFGGWELLTYWSAGESSFLHNLRAGNGGNAGNRTSLVVPLITLLGGLAPSIPFLVWIQHRRATVGVGATAAAYTLGTVVVAFIPVASFGGPRLDSVVFGLLGMLLWASVFYATTRHWRRVLAADKKVIFLAAWLGFELVGYFVMSPFPASRRLIGLAFVLGLFVSRISQHPLRSRPSKALMTLVAGVSLGMTLLISWLDILEARTAQLAAQIAKDVEVQTSQVVYFTGSFGYEYYATLYGLHPLFRGTSLPAGTLLVHHTYPILSPDEPTYSGSAISLQRTVPLEAFPPLTTLPLYLGNRPFERFEGTRGDLKFYELASGSP